MRFKNAEDERKANTIDAWVSVPSQLYTNIEWEIRLDNVHPKCDATNRRKWIFHSIQLLAPSATLKINADYLNMTRKPHHRFLAWVKGTELQASTTGTSNGPQKTSVYVSIYGDRQALWAYYVLWRWSSRLSVCPRNSQRFAFHRTQLTENRRLSPGLLPHT